jgi:AMMECR1 domain-containing protein
MDLSIVSRKVIETYLNEKKILSISELLLMGSEYLDTKHLSFVTLYKDGKVIASSGRVHIKKENTVMELIENTLFCLKDERFIEAIKNPLELKHVKFRVDIITNAQRKVIKSLDEVDPKTDGLILISQTKNALGVILPNITNMVSTSQELFTLVCKKAGLVSTELKDEDYILYKIQSTVFSEF